MHIFRLAVALRKTAGRAWTALLDSRVPGRLKLIAVAAAIFIVSPLNVLGDIPLLGVLDDGALLSLVLVWFTRASLPHLMTYEAQPIKRR